MTSLALWASASQSTMRLSKSSPPSRVSPDLESTIAHLKHRHVEGAAAKVEDKNGFVALRLKAVGQRRGGGLVDDAQHLNARDLARVLGGLALTVVEVGRHRDDRLVDVVAQELGGVTNQLAQHLRANLFGGEILACGIALDLNVARAVAVDVVRHLLTLLANLAVLAADEALHAVEGVLRVDDAL